MIKWIISGKKIEPVFLENIRKYGTTSNRGTTWSTIRLSSEKRVKLSGFDKEMTPLIAALDTKIHTINETKM